MDEEEYDDVSMDTHPTERSRAQRAVNHLTERKRKPEGEEEPPSPLNEPPDPQDEEEPQSPQLRRSTRTSRRPD